MRNKTFIFTGLSPDFVFLSIDRFCVSISYFHLRLLLFGFGLDLVSILMLILLFVLALGTYEIYTVEVVPLCTYIL